ncbi:MAG: hypothetical protein P1P64_02470 [Treponemataceae bacterium]
MFLKIIKESFLKIKKIIGKLFWANFLLMVLYFLFFLCFSFFRFSAIIVGVLKVLYFFIISFFTIPVLLFINSKSEVGANFLGIIKKTWKKAVFYASLISFLATILVWLLRFFVEKKQGFLTGLTFSSLVLGGLMFAYLPAILVLTSFQKGKSFLQALKKSVFYFLQNPAITFLLFLMQVCFQALAVFSLFVLPTWFLPQVFFTQAIKNFYQWSKNKKSV